MSVLAINKSTIASDVWFDALKMFVRLDDGKQIPFHSIGCLL